MDYDKLTKAELIQKLKEQKHLAEAVNAKDKEIAELKKTYETKVHQLEKSVTSIKNDYTGSMKREEVDKLVKETEKNKQEAKQLAQFYVKMYHDFLKQTQQNLEMALFTEQVVSEKFKK